jgi:hypothetical protein
MSVAPNTSTQKAGTLADEEDRMEKELLADGVLDQLPSPVADESAYRQWQPIPWESTPVSQTILEERR